MRIKTSVTLPEELLRDIDKADENRSGFLERAARHYLLRLDRVRQEEQDAAIYEKELDYLNAEAMDCLEYQVTPA